MPNLPHNIWVHVAQYLPALFLQDLITVNRSFFEIAMDCRYRQLILAYMDSRMVKNLVRLRDPAVAKRVQVLHIYPGFLPQSNSAPLLFDQAKPECMASKRSFRTILTDIANSLLEQRTFPSRHPKYRMMQSLRKQEDVVQVVSDVLAGLPNVTDYYVTWYGLPTVTSSPAPFVASALRPNLRKLSLNLSLENVQSILSSDTQITRLEELHLCIHSETVCNDQERTYILQHHLAPAICRFRSTLKTLVIESWEPTDLSPLFANIERIPVLDDLCINIPVERCHLGDPAGVSGFLKKHQSTLRCLRLRATQYGGRGLAPDLCSLHEWISEATEKVELPKLRELDISSNLFPTDTSLLCLKRFSRTLTSSTMTGVYRSYEQVVQALDNFLMPESGFSDSPATKEVKGNNLKRLRIGPVSLSPQLVDLIASRIPELRRLELLVRDILPGATDASSSALFLKDELPTHFTLVLVLITGGVLHGDGDAAISGLAVGASVNRH
ncbi:hypothetical protein MD484_g4480, partial [Candolleomyces efflorescens]